MNSTLISISGPTAVGKTLFAIELAKKLDTEIISFDSRQFYKEISIGTAVPSKDELAQVKHHFIQHKSIHDQYKVSDYLHDVDELIKTFLSKKKYRISKKFNNFLSDHLKTKVKNQKNQRSLLRLFA